MQLQHHHHVGSGQHFHHHLFKLYQGLKNKHLKMIDGCELCVAVCPMGTPFIVMQQLQT